MTSAAPSESKPGDELRDHAARILSSRFGKAKTEYRTEGKKVDVFFQYDDLGKLAKLYVEAKDYSRPLQRSDVAHIKVDYEGIIKKNAPSKLLIVTRNGLTPDAQKYIDDENAECHHQTIWEIEKNSINFDQYLNHLYEEPQTSGLSNFYIKSGFEFRKPTDTSHHDFTIKTQSIFDEKSSCFDAVVRWATSSSENTPLAILGGYGSGKTSLSRMLASHFAHLSQLDPYQRQPILLRLGNFSQYSSIEGLLGGYFTNDFPVPYFHIPNFLHLNKIGRYIIILDGFDEMKHSMSWNDFRLQVQNLLKLQNEKSKIILLGRPSAFLSDIEDRYILKGERPIGDSWIRIPDWPRFHEIQLKSFSQSERQEFINKYLITAAKGIESEKVAERARTANEIADGQTELFSKPVHSKILTDLATDPNFDLTVFKNKSSRWMLYDEFINSIYTREIEKISRSQIPIEKRLHFLEKLAFWLWNKKGTQISLSISDVPEVFVKEVVGENCEDLISATRELFIGSILERKSGDVFYFGHRSFAEFLVSNYMLKNPPAAGDHESFSNCYSDGVREFLSDANKPNIVADWSLNFSSATGRITQSYIDFISEPIGGIEKLVDGLSPISPWRQILSPFVGNLSATKENYLKVVESLFNCQSLAFCWQYCWLSQLENDQWQQIAKLDGRGSSKFSIQIILSLLNSLFGNVTGGGTNLFVSESHAGLRRICSQAVKVYELDDGRSEFEWSHSELLSACQKELLRFGIVWEQEVKFTDRSFTIGTDDFFKKLNKKSQDNLLIFLRHVKRWVGITERSNKPLGRREVSGRK